MQGIIDWLTSHWSIVAVVVYEVWSLIPDSVVKSSSILTLLAGLIKKPASLP